MVNFKEDEQLSTLNHSCAHLMAQAIKHLYPQAKFWVGPVVAEGFYYDVDLGDDVIRDEDIPKIEKEMKKVAKSGKKIIRKEISKEEAMEMFKDDEYKLDLISNLEDGTITCYEQEILQISVVDHTLIMLSYAVILSCSDIQALTGRATAIIRFSREYMVYVSQHQKNLKHTFRNLRKLRKEITER